MPLDDLSQTAQLFDHNLHWLKTSSATTDIRYGSITLIHGGGAGL
jgi:hypothetical protein